MDFIEHCERKQCFGLLLEKKVCVGRKVAWEANVQKYSGFWKNKQTKENISLDTIQYNDEALILGEVLREDCLHIVQLMYD